MYWPHKHTWKMYLLGKGHRCMKTAVSVCKTNAFWNCNNHLGECPLHWEDFPNQALTEFRSSSISLSADCALWHFRFRPPPLAQYWPCSTSATTAQCKLSAVRCHYFHTIPVVISELVLDSFMMRWRALHNAHVMHRHVIHCQNTSTEPSC